jgi:hypothetical protein
MKAGFIPRAGSGSTSSIKPPAVGCAQLAMSVVRFGSPRPLSCTNIHDPSQTHGSLRFAVHRTVAAPLPGGAPAPPSSSSRTTRDECAALRRTWPVPHPSTCGLQQRQGTPPPSAKLRSASPCPPTTTGGTTVHKSGVRGTIRIKEKHDLQCALHSWCCDVGDIAASYHVSVCCDSGPGQGLPYRW